VHSSLLVIGSSRLKHCLLDHIKDYLEHFSKLVMYISMLRILFLHFVSGRVTNSSGFLFGSCFAPPRGPFPTKREILFYVGGSMFKREENGNLHSHLKKEPLV
jgi:hypothetical protein